MKTVKPEILSKQTLRCVCYWTLPHRRPLCNYCCIHWMSWLVPKTLLAPIWWSQIHRRSNIKVQLVDRSGSTKVYNFIWLSSLFLASLLSLVLYPPFSIRPLKHPIPSPPTPSVLQRILCPVSICHWRNPSRNRGEVIQDRLEGYKRGEVSPQYPFCVREEKKEVINNVLLWTLKHVLT